MKYASIRDFRINASKVFNDVEDDGVIVTKKGRPIALLVPVDENNIDTIRESIIRAKALIAINSIRKEAEKNQLTELTIEEIDNEIN